MQQTNVLEYLENTVTRLPDKVAYSNGEFDMTFADVYAHARAIGSFIADKGLEREPVVIFMEKHPRAIAAFFGCIYAGSFYVPIDAEMPRLRINLILENLKPRLTICDETTISQAREMPLCGEIALYEDAVKTKINDEALSDIRRRQLDTDPIYIVFTSGSTGVPKGVVACHRSVIDYIENLSDVMGFSEQTRFANQTPLYFDACLKELYPTIKFGATTYLVPKKLFSFPVPLVEFLNRYEINTICWVVSALTMISTFNTFDVVKPLFLHTIAFGSEVFPIKQFNIWREALPDASFTNLYGPTEATGMSCYYKVDRSFTPGDVIPIGRPFHNTQILLLDENGKEVRRGKEGEICIRGTALALGYYHNFEKTSEAFVQNPLNDRYPELIYRTGDIGKLNERGELVFVSRVDYQIKHMGHRVELGEIEMNVNEVGGIRSACCIYDEKKSKIILYYTGEQAEKELRGILKEHLPRYMLPARITRLERMPLTPNGKLDRVALKNKYESEERK